MNVSNIMLKIGKNGKDASQGLRRLSSNKKNETLSLISETISRNRDRIIEANKTDVRFAHSKDLSESMIDRLLINDSRLDGIIKSIHQIIDLPDPVGSIVEQFSRPNGLIIKKVRTPIGTIGVIFESRPNVFVDAGALCIKSGNASILRCGSESFNTAQVFEKCFISAFKQSGISEFSTQLVPTRDRLAVEEMLKMNEFIDVIVPRGGKGLVQLVQEKARVPIFAHLEGIVHIYVHEDADPLKAKEIIINSKTRRPGICGAVECLLIDKKFISAHGTSLISDLLLAGVSVKVSDELSNIEGTLLANNTDWGKEFLEMTIAVKVVDTVDQAVSHIELHGSNHTDCIITENDQVSEQFFLELDSAIVMRNASTQFADGGEFGFGSEIGIATGKLHARGPVGLEQLTSFQYLVEGSGQTRK